MTLLDKTVKPFKAVIVIVLDSPNGSGKGGRNCDFVEKHGHRLSLC